MPIVDIHTHMFPPALMSILRSRTSIPYVRSFPSPSPSSGEAPKEEERMILLPSEETSTATSRGRPIGPAYHDIRAKLAFMDAHGIEISVISIANPWLDFLAAEEAASKAMEVNDDVERMCAEFPGRLYSFGTLPLSASVNEIVGEVERLKGLKYCRGVVMGTSGLGEGLDDPRLDEVYGAVERSGMVIFLHPHYGLPNEVYGPRAGEYGHVLPLSIGFPVETTIAVTRMLLSGIWDRFPELKVLLAHSGGTLPFLAGRIESCIAHDAHLKKKGKIGNRRDVWDILKKNIYLDAVVYSPVGLKAAIEASGSDRLLFGTDHPFFPPLDESETQWASVTTNYKSLKSVATSDSALEDAVLGGNAVRILRLGE